MKKQLIPIKETRSWKKIVLKTKLTLALFLFGLVSVSAATYSQNTKLSISLKNNNIVELIKEIEQKSEFYFFYKKEELKDVKNISVDFENATVMEILDKVIEDSDLAYKVVDRYVVLRKKGQSMSIDEAVQQQKTITGTVTDETGLSLPGVTVIIKGTTNGAVTNMEGTYTISNIPDNATLVFSFVGMLSQEIAVSSQTTIDVSMKTDAIGIEEVIAIGFGTMKKADLTGAISTVQGDELAKRVDATNTTTALQGISPGLTVQNFAGEPGREDVRIRIRGNGTLNNSNPLVLVDGVERALSTVEPGDIESLTVLKDAASASIYGSRAANGVILITTKRGAAGGTVVSYDYNVGFQNVLGYPEIADTETWMNLENEAFVNAGSPPKRTQEEMDHILSGDMPFEYPWTNYEDYLFHDNSPQQRHSISLSSGGENGRIFASVNYLDKDGIINNFNEKRLSARVNSDLYVTDKITASFNMNYMNHKSTGPGHTAQRLVQGMMHIPRDIVGRYPDGTWDLVSGSWNSVAMMDNGERILDRDEFSTQIGLEYKILPTLTFKGNVTLKTYAQSESTFMNSLSGMRNYVTGDLVTVGGWFATNSLTETQANTKEWSQRAYMNYNEKFGKHSIEGMLGYEGINNKYAGLEGYRQNFYNNDLRDLDSGASAAQSSGGGREEWALQSIFGRVNYAYDDKYLFQANVRYDGSSRFADGNRWGIFPSFSGGWRISQEGFLADNEAITNLRQGIMGSIREPEYWPLQISEYL